jgi:vacuolar protein-sorting-associated protein 4
VLGATNLPWTIDSAIRRRFEKRVYIALPDENARKNLLRNMIAKERHTLSDSEIDTIVSKTDGFSGADMAVLIKDAGMEPVRKC